MSSTGIDYTGDAQPSDDSKVENGHTQGNSDNQSTGKADQTHRRLKARHIQLIGIGGTIGTALYVRSVS
jgi:yeast amino acid transporter